MYFEALCAALRGLPEIEALVLGGSRAGEGYDRKSDYDLYVYCTEIPPAEARREILGRVCGHMELGNDFWELEDDCVLLNGIPIDILYRNLDSFARDIASVAELHYARNGYATCMWHNLLHSRILYDRDGRYAALRQRFDVPYPEALRQNIIRRNLRLLTGNLPSYDAQLRKAVSREDRPSVNHRMAAFLESYFDILFALNRMTHPGEKAHGQHIESKGKDSAEGLRGKSGRGLCLYVRKSGTVPGGAGRDGRESSGIGGEGDRSRWKSYMIARIFMTCWKTAVDTKSQKGTGSIS